MPNLMPLNRILRRCRRQCLNLTRLLAGLSLFRLLAALLLGLLPCLALGLLSLGWCLLPNSPGLDLSWLTLAALLLAPFIAGYANCRWLGRYSLHAGALPAFLLWGLALALYWRLFGPPEDYKRGGIILAVALAMGIAGAITAARRPAKIGPKTAKQQSPPA